ncbi:hypothetical protein PTSG_08177 [Salpingoeca rosetta]|uniref:AD domain-containing protein n=1 Tax=Salpingoeca rosetta (strain ATCC 50818 / BSB-021) TaxID=946362 RepID=F2UI81_SALR5|nr:uncharacterized protein PTSG_08177 [Salpingoeca rosetta]EGD76830.1 hypothetical protein PTSG_08177 [Salpingoeca rosetta]|eukprot:XP_004991202.1 hypothetical protein PTSG_08177 [Salpingoeca rosetta]
MADIEGRKVVVTTRADETITGYVYDWNEAQNMLILRVQGAKTELRPDFRIINTAFIKECQCPDKSQTLKMKGPSYVDVAARQEELKRAVQKAHGLLRSDREGAPEIAKHIYRELSKTLECKWGPDHSILVRNVKIASPYTKESCTLADSARPVPKKTLSYIQERVAVMAESFAAAN